MTVAQFRSVRDEPASFQLDLLLDRSRVVKPMQEEYLGCTLKIARVDLDGVSGKLDCPGPLPSGFSGIEFEVAE